MTDRCETLRDCRTSIPSSFLKVSNLYTICYVFCESTNDQNRMCELCIFPNLVTYCGVVEGLKYHL